MKLSDLIKATGKYDLTIFSQEAVDRIEQSIFEKKDKYFLKCLKRNTDIQVKPEEIVRQLMIDKLINEYHYPLDLLAVEYVVNFGTQKKYADIVILNKADKTSVYCVLEIKKHKGKDGKEQLKSYTHATGSPLAVWTNGVRSNLVHGSFDIDNKYFLKIIESCYKILHPIMYKILEFDQITNLKDENIRLKKENESLKLSLKLANNQVEVE